MCCCSFGCLAVRAPPLSEVCRDCPACDVAPLTDSLLSVQGSSMTCEGTPRLVLAKHSDVTVLCSRRWQFNTASALWYTLSAYCNRAHPRERASLPCTQDLVARSQHAQVRLILPRSCSYSWLFDMAQRSWCLRHARSAGACARSVASPLEFLPLPNLLRCLDACDLLFRWQDPSFTPRARSDHAMVITGDEVLARLS